MRPLTGAVNMGGWAAEEFGTAEQGDARPTKRLVKVAIDLAEKPTASLPGPSSSWGETLAAYNFFDQTSEKKQGIGWGDLLTPHMDCTLCRMRKHQVVLCLQDSTELDFNGQGIQGLWPLSYEAQRGLYLHPTCVVTPDREPLGTGIQGCARQSARHSGEHPLDRGLRAGGRNRRDDAGHASGVCRRLGSRYSGADATGARPGNAGRLADPFAAQSLSSGRRQTVGSQVRSGEALGFIEFMLPARGS